MLKEAVLTKILEISLEEQNYLTGNAVIDKSIFIEENSNIVDYHKIASDQPIIAIRRHPRFCSYPKHRHNYLELMYVYQGQMSHLINEQVITIKQGELLLLNQNIEHAIGYTEAEDIIFNFIIKPEFLRFMASLVEAESKVFSFIFAALYSNKNDGEYLLFKSSDNHVVEYLVEELVTCTVQPPLNQALNLKLTMGLLLTELMNHPEQIIAYTGNSFDKILSGSILKYIHLHYHEGSLAKLSQQLHQPDYKICKVVKKYTGYTFKQLVQMERLRIAGVLLTTTKLPVLKVMEEVGYDNVTYFYQLFKEYYHITPKEYRENGKIG